MKAAAVEAVTAQGSLIEKQAYSLGVNADADQQLAALQTRAMTVIDSAAEIGAIIRPRVRNEALEEAAQVASDEEIGVSPENLTEFSKGYLRACRDIAAAIRALKEKEDG